MKTCLTVRDKSGIGEIDKIADPGPRPTSRLWPKGSRVDDNPVLSQSSESPEWKVITMQNLCFIHCYYLVNN
jgi:hypothetical protein|tara:strand:+ start:42 stop:257 length:216 start_codon:yes stop_codon:yes gene_type:complete